MKLNRINTDLEESDRLKLVENMQDRIKVLSFYPAERNIVVVLESTTTTVWKYNKVSIFPLSSYLVVNDMFVPLFEHEGFCQQTKPTTIWNLNLGVANRTFLYHFSILQSV